ncbi:MAG: surface-adhesin E family protein [Betaproteobacteria bacterium]
MTTITRLICGLLLATLAGGAGAAWERVGVTDDGMVIYADPATLKKTDEIVKMWGLLDYKTPEKDGAGKPYSSVKLLQEFDCKSAQGRTRYFSFHAGPMGTGLLVHSEMRATSEWLPANRARPGELLWKFACGKK